MIQHDLFDRTPALSCGGIPQIMRRIAEHSARPRYTFMVLDLIARVADKDGQAGPFVNDGTALVPIRQWLAAAISPIGLRHHRRRAAAQMMHDVLKAAGALPVDPDHAEQAIANRLEDRICKIGMTSVSRAVSELVRAGLIRRHYEGYVVDHVNRGAQRQAVYTLLPAVQAAFDPSLARSVSPRQSGQGLRTIGEQGLFDQSCR